jgi:hypothetical protein
MPLAVCFAIHNKSWNEHFHGDQDVKCGGLGMPRHEIICNKRMHLKITFWMEDSAYQIQNFAEVEVPKPNDFGKLILLRVKR